MFGEILSVRLHKFAVVNVPDGGKAVIAAVEEKLISNHDDWWLIFGEILSVRVHNLPLAMCPTAARLSLSRWKRS